MSALLLGLDIGTSSVKAALFDAQGRLLAVTRVPQPVYSPHPGWAEQDPADWQAGAWKSLRQVLKDRDPRQVIAVGLTGQCPSHALVDGAGRPLGRAIIWRDSRAQQEAVWLDEHISPQQTLAFTGSSHLGDPMLPPARLLWLREHRQRAWERARHIFQPKDFVGFLLTGEAATDIHSAFCLATPGGGYAPEYLDILGIPANLLPPPLPATAILGKVTPLANEQTGLRSGIPVVVGTIDAYCETIAGGGLAPGRAVDVAGTSEILSLGVSGEVTDDGVYLARLGYQGQFLCGPTQAGGDTLRWLLEGFFASEDFPLPYESLAAEAGSVPPGSLGLVFLPYLSGERAPLWDSALRGALLGLTLQHNRAHFARAVFEGVGYAIRHILEVCESASGLNAEFISICGGGSGNSFWNQIKADILQRPVFPAAVLETACLGASMLAAVAIDLYASLPQAGLEMSHFGRMVRPRQKNAPIYEAGYRLFRSYYPALRAAYRV